MQPREVIESNASGGGAVCAPPQEHARSLLVLQVATILWMLIECGVSLSEARLAHSPALMAFGSDSFVELLSATVVLLQLRPRFPLDRKRAATMAGLLLFVLAGAVTVIAILGLISETNPAASPLGMTITAAALIVMPILASKKRRLARMRKDAALAADAVQSATCAYLAGITLVGLGANFWFHLRWIDPLAALIAAPILLIEAKRALRGDACGCC
jgi:divalent metal cation (Fe/Co/Zn/Cd) transporter